MDFQTKIRELDFIHARLRAERIALEQRNKHDQDLQVAISQVKQDQVTAELQKLEKWRIQMKSRHSQLQKEAKTSNSNHLQLRKEQLELAKINFIEELGRRDPQWHSKMQIVRQRQLQKLEDNKGQIAIEVQIKEKRLQEEVAAHRHIEKMRSELMLNQEKMNYIENERKRRMQQQELQLQIIQPIEEVRLITEPVSEKFEGGMPFQPAKFQENEVQMPQQVVQPKQKKNIPGQAVISAPEQHSFLTAPQPIVDGASFVENSGDTEYYEMLDRRAQAQSPQTTELRKAQARVSSPPVEVQIARNAPSNMHQLDDSDTPSEEIKKQQVDQEESLYYDEEEAEEPPESQDRNPLIRIPPNKRIDETFSAIPALQKTMFAGVVLDYISMNLSSQTQNQGSTLFFKPREVQADREMKFLLINLYNKLLDKMVAHTPDGSFDLGVACDCLLDLLRYESSEIVDPKLVVQDFLQCKEKGIVYSTTDFYMRFKNKYLLEIFKGIVKLVAQAIEFKLVTQLAAVSNTLVDAVCSINPLQTRQELAKVLVYLIEQLNGSNVQIYGAATGRSQGSNKSSGRNSHPKISESERVSYAELLKDLIESRAKSENPYSDVTRVNANILSLESIKLLNKQEKQMRSDMAVVVLLLLLKTRTEQNISHQALAYCEESGDFGEFSGLITNSVAKSLFDIIVKHFSQMISDGHLSQIDAEQLLVDSLINFKCGSYEQNFVKQYVISALQQQLRMLKSQTKVAGSVSTNSYNQQFNQTSQNNQQFVAGTRSKLKSSTFSRSSGKDNDIDDEISQVKRQKVSEFDEPEIVDDF